MSYDELPLLCHVFVSRLVSLAASRRHSNTPTSASLRTARPPSDHTPRANSSHAPLTPRRRRACRSTKAPTKNISARRVVLRSRLPNGLMRNVPPGRRSGTGDRRAACNEKRNVKRRSFITHVDRTCQQSQMSEAALDGIPGPSACLSSVAKKRTTIPAAPGHRRLFDM